MPLNTAKILGVKINSTSASSVLETILDFVAKKGRNSLKEGKPLVVFTPNPEFLVAAAKDEDFKRILNQADINLADGVGLLIAGRILGQVIKERISGADLVERLLEVGNKEEWRVGITGARRGDKTEAKILLERLRKKYPLLHLVDLDNSEFLISNFKFQNIPPSAGQNSKDQILNVKNDSLFNIHNSRFNVVFACQGMGKQERWIIENKDQIRAAVFMAVGSSLDYLAGFSRRAPAGMRKMGLEWLWRGIQRPRHFKRIWRATVVFGWLVIKKYLSSKFKVQSSKLQLKV